MQLCIKQTNWTLHIPDSAASTSCFLQNYLLPNITQHSRHLNDLYQKKGLPQGSSGVPRNFVRGGGGQQIQLRTEDRENGDLGAVAL